MDMIMAVLFVVSPLDKVFRDTQPPKKPEKCIRVFCARNEYEPAQVAVRPSKGLKNVTVEISALKHEKEAYTLPARGVTWNFVGFIPLTKNTPHTREAAIVRKAPCEIPDPLLPDRKMDVAADRTQPIWLTFFVPKDAPPGVYRGTVTVKADGWEQSLPVELTVWPFALPDERHLFVTNWFSVSKIAKTHKVALYSDEFFALMEKYYRNMAAHRQNVAWVDWRTIKVTRDNGKLSFDYALFDRFIELMEKCGVADRIEIMFVARHSEGGWGSKEISFCKVKATDRKTGKEVLLDFDEGMAVLLADLEKHLEARGRLERTVIHVCDEPAQHNILSWREKSRMLHKAAPRLKRIDAIEASDFGDDLDVWVPKLSHLRRWYPWYDRARERGAEVWYYICCHPFGGYFPNRFLDYNLSMVRLLHWINCAYDLKGYLHWGLAFWPEDPFGPPPERLPPGDTHVIYPGPDGPLNSMRWEVQRDSLEDYEYLYLLTQRMKETAEALGPAAQSFDPAERSKEFCKRLIRSFADVRDDPALIQAVRKELAAEIIAAGQEPPVILTTRPVEGTELVPGPIVVEVHGAVLPGTEIKGNCTVQVEKNGRFRGSKNMSSADPVIRLTFTRGGKSKEMVRRFPVRGAEK